MNYHTEGIKLNKENRRAKQEREFRSFKNKKSNPRRRKV